MQLDLNYCENLNIDISIPIIINETDLFKYDPNDDYYNDKCYPYKTESGTDLTIYDRKNDYNSLNMSLCEANCQYKGYDSNIKKVSCQCKIKTKFNLFSEDFNQAKENLLMIFTDLQKSMNLFVITCYKILFRKDGLIHNIGSYILLIIIIIHLIGIVFLFKKELQSFEMQIKEIINMKKNNKYEKK